MLGALVAFVLSPCLPPAQAQTRPEIISPKPDSVAVTIYRDPQRGQGGGMNLDYLNGFAVVTEMRTVSVPAGPSTIRFAGVAEGMVAVSAVVRGLPGGIVEQNRDKKLLSLELTNAWINEARELPYEIVRGVLGRIGRYPRKVDGGPVQPCLVMDTNPMDTDHWWYRKFEIEQPEGWELFKQPPAMIKTDGRWQPNPQAENIINLPGAPYEYYKRLIPGNDDNWIGVYVAGQYGAVMDGKPVYPDYRDDIHCAKEDLGVLRGVPLYIGFDYGRTPAAVFVQFSPRGQFRIIDELVVDTDGDGMGIRTFMREVVMPHIAANYSGMKIIARGDPAGIAKDGNELSCFDIQREEGMDVEPASTNDLTPRIDSISRHMKTMIDGEPGFLLSPKCKTLRKGFLGGYKYVRVEVRGEERYRDVPDKNRFSHPHDAGQYAGLAVLEGQSESRSVARPVQRANRGAFV